MEILARVMYWKYKMDLLDDYENLILELKYNQAIQEF